MFDLPKVKCTYALLTLFQVQVGTYYSYLMPYKNFTTIRAISTNTGVGGGRIELLCYHKFMRKLLLLLFLFSLSSNAFAKVEIWECDGKYWKIDSGIPKVYVRYNGKWLDLSKASDMQELDEDPEHKYLVFKYASKHDSIFIYKPDSEEYIGVVDLFTKEIFQIKDGDLELAATCKLYVQ